MFNYLLQKFSPYVGGFLASSYFSGWQEAAKYLPFGYMRNKTREFLQGGSKATTTQSNLDATLMILSDLSINLVANQLMAEIYEDEDLKDFTENKLLMAAFRTAISGLLYRLYQVSNYGFKSLLKVVTLKSLADDLLTGVLRGGVIGESIDLVRKLDNANSDTCAVALAAGGALGEGFYVTFKQVLESNIKKASLETTKLAQNATEVIKVSGSSLILKLL